MAQLSEAIAHYHKLLCEGAYGDLTWVQEFQERMEEQHIAGPERLPVRSSCVLISYLEAS